MAFDYTNVLETDAGIEPDFRFTNRAGTVLAQGAGVSGDNTAGEWCLNTDGSTTSSGTGCTAHYPGTSGTLYTEASSPVASSVWAMKRNDSFDNTIQDVYLDLSYNLNVDVGSEFYIEYATVASPNETTDWTILETIAGTLTDSWIDDTFDFSGVASTTTLWIRIRFNSLNAFTNDLCFSTWREYSVDLGATEQEGFRFREDNGSETGADWKELQDVDATVAKEENIRLRMLVDTEYNTATRQITFQYKRDDEAASEWRDV